MFREIVHGFLVVIMKNIVWNNIVKETTRQNRRTETRANQRAGSEEKEKTYIVHSNLPSRDVVTIFKTRRRRSEFYIKMAATETKNTRFWPENSRLCCLAMPIRWKIGLRRDT